MFLEHPYGIKRAPGRQVLLINVLTFTLPHYFVLWYVDNKIDELCHNHQRITIKMYNKNSPTLSNLLARPSTTICQNMYESTTVCEIIKIYHFFITRVCKTRVCRVTRVSQTQV